MISNSGISKSKSGGVEPGCDGVVVGLAEGDMGGVHIGL